MKSICSKIDEFKGDPFQPQRMNHSDAMRLADVTNVIISHFITDERYGLSVNKGSLTLQHLAFPHRVIKIFIDFDNKLANKCKINIHPDPIVIGIELSYEVPFYRHAVREFLREHFIYVDPEGGGNKYWLNPMKDNKDQHFYDIVFLGKGPCPYPLDEYQAESLEDLLNRTVENAETEHEVLDFTENGILHVFPRGRKE